MDERKLENGRKGRRGREGRGEREHETRNEQNDRPHQCTKAHEIFNPSTTASCSALSAFCAKLSLQRNPRPILNSTVVFTLAAVGGESEPDGGDAAEAREEMTPSISSSRRGIGRKMDCGGGGGGEWTDRRGGGDRAG